MQPQRRQHVVSPPRQRRGSLVPAMAIAFLVVGCALALVLDSLWLQTAASEVQRAADAAALAAARQLASDELLKIKPDHTSLADQARLAAAEIGSANQAGGKGIAVNADTDVAIGRVVLEDGDGEPRFVDSDEYATSAAVLAHCDRASGNPISRFFPHLTGQPPANVGARAEATVNNQLLGVRPFDNAPAPVLPLAILELHSDPRRMETWVIQVEGRRGADTYRFNPETYEVEQGSDGLPELTLTSTLPGNEEEEEKRGNVQLIDVGTRLKTSELVRQIQQGWSWQDLQDYGSEFRLAGGMKTLRSQEHISGAPVEALDELKGQVRMALLYRSSPPGVAGGNTLAQVSRFVAVRIMSVREQDSSLKMTVQPAVIVTRTALVEETWGGRSSVLANPYVYRLSLTY